MDLFRDTVAGQLIYYGSRRKVLYYVEEDPNWIVPAHYLETITNDTSPGPRQEPSPSQTRPFASHASSQQSLREGSYTLREEVGEPLQERASRLLVIQDDRRGSHSSNETTVVGQKKQSEKTSRREGGEQPRHEVTEMLRAWEEEARTVDNTPSSQKHPNCVDWYGPNDPDNPRNWSLFKKCFVTFDLCFLTFRYALLPLRWADFCGLCKFAAFTWAVQSSLRA